MSIPRPAYLSYDDLRAKAAEFREQFWPSGGIPVDVEHIIDVELGVDIVPVLHLSDLTEVDGFLAADGSEIYVDRGVYEHPKLYRYRFTLAHELAHLYLHENLLEVMEFDSVEGWLEFQASVPEEARSWYEWQAYAFAGLILVPEEGLREKIGEAVVMASEGGFRVDLSEEAHRTYLAEWIGRRFEVSQEVILRRGRYDGHWIE